MRNTRGNTLLVELTVVILFFAVSQAVVLQVFAKAQQVNRHTAVLNRALLFAEKTAETLAATDDVRETLISLGFAEENDGYETAEGGEYRVTATVANLKQPSGVLHTVTLNAYQGEELLFTLPATRYVGGEQP